MLIQIHGKQKLTEKYWGGQCQKWVWPLCSQDSKIGCISRKNVSSWFFRFYWSCKKYTFLGLCQKTLLANQFAWFFTFDLFDLLILILGVHCYIVLVLFVCFYRSQFCSPGINQISHSQSNLVSIHLAFLTGKYWTGLLNLCVIYTNIISKLYQDMYL